MPEIKNWFIHPTSCLLKKSTGRLTCVNVPYKDSNLSKTIRIDAEVLKDLQKLEVEVIKSDKNPPTYY